MKAGKNHAEDCRDVGYLSSTWMLFEQDRASVEEERTYLLARRARDEFWYADRFALPWPRLEGEQPAPFFGPAAPLEASPTATYEVRGMVATLTSHDNAAVGQGNVVNECEFEYNDFSQLVTEYQEHDGAVNTSTTPKVEYGYTGGSANTIRPTGITYPNGRVITYDYGTADGIDDASSRIASIIDDDTTHLNDYSYLGQRTVVVGNRPQPQVKFTLVDLNENNDPDTGDIYSGLDRFGRGKDNRWYDYDGDADVDRIKYGYDRAGNRLWRENVVAAILDKDFDELYLYDGLYRLIDMQRGRLNAQKTAILDKTFAQDWVLDEVGNWKAFDEDDNGDGTWSLEQARDHNKVNEITGITNVTGPDWPDPVHDPAGNMTKMPKPLEPSESFTATYDAWNRLVKLTDDADNGKTVAEYAFDAEDRRVIEQTFESGALAETRHCIWLWSERVVKPHFRQQA